MAEALHIKVAKRVRTTIDFYLDPAPATEGETPAPDGPYHFIAPKAAMMILPAISGDDEDQAASIRAVFDWLGSGLNAWDWENGQGRETVTSDGDAALVPVERTPEWAGPQVQRIEARLRAPDDDLDIDTLSDLIRELAAVETERPPT